MVDYRDPSELGRRPPGTPAPRKSSDVLTDRLLQMRTRAEQAERQRDEAAAQNRELREQLSTLHQALPTEGGAAAGDNVEVDALRQELARVKSQAAAEREALQRQLSDGSATDAAARNVELKAELQAAHQEALVLRQAVREKDKVLEDLAAQCRSLEDNLEDRDRELERFRRDLDQSQLDSSFIEDSAVSVLGVDSIVPDSEPLYAFQDKDSSEILDGAALSSPTFSNRSRRTVVLAAGGGLLVGVLAVIAVFLFKDASLPSGNSATPSTTRQQAPSVVPASPRGTQAQAATANQAAKTAEASEPVDVEPMVARDRLHSGAQGPLLASIPGGSFEMGNKRGLLNKAEQPAHQVELKPFSIGIYEVTFAEYDAFAKATGRRLPSDSGWGRGDRPVVDVTWDDALAYTRWLSQQTGKKYRLPTEAEWEYAARAGTTDRYWWGINAGKGRAVCFDCGTEWDGRSTAPVGSLAPNPYGLYDTSGNVMEWVEDCYHPNYQNAPEDGSAWVSGDCSQRMVRGGAFNKPSSSMRNAARYQLPQETNFNMLGFRVVRE